ncbi:MAG: molybdopterin adenylyltransferase [Rhodobacteraceae bacterium GWE1_64_9]|nr:MAG: molybdopterin adenylyltransferase [Rhodobacteraceae bacterium GWE1_64_9]OHC51493.1 MAG: molybdopterin adenylyltransferase [Rhodobacteraceae bacterium GWF1_65_7]HBD90244.1 molybdopterin adenylyltransferase [Gemmobacter sp.]
MAKIAVLTVSDRAAAGIYEDKGGPAIEAWLRRAITSAVDIRREIVPDGRDVVAGAFRRWADDEGADLILATGGTGPSPRDLTPEAMDDVVDRHFPGFGELMRAVSLREVPTAILSRQGAGTRGRSLIITLPGKPSAIGTCLDAVFPAVPYCLDLMGAARIETDPAVCAVFRPKG